MPAIFHAKSVTNGSQEAGIWVCSPSDFTKALMTAFHAFPVVLEEKDLKKLHDLTALCSFLGYAPIDNPYQRLTDLIHEWGPIEVYQKEDS